MAVKKQWYEIVSPKMFGGNVIGETLSADPKMMKGRTVQVNMAELSSDSGKFYVKTILQIDGLEGQKLNTKFIGHEVMRERLYRMIQRRTTKVDAIQDVETKDAAKVRVKTLMIIKRKSGTSIKNAIRAGIKKSVASIARDTDLEPFINMILSGELAAKLRQECKKITPISSVEIRKSEIIPAKVIAE